MQQYGSNLLGENGLKLLLLWRICREGKDPDRLGVDVDRLTGGIDE